MGEVWSFLKFCCRRLVFSSLPFSFWLSSSLVFLRNFHLGLRFSLFQCSAVERKYGNMDRDVFLARNRRFAFHRPPRRKVRLPENHIFGPEFHIFRRNEPGFFFRRRNLFDLFYVEICKYLARCSQAEIRPKCPEGARNSPPFAGFFFGIAETCVAVSRDHGCFRFFATGFAEQNFLVCFG